MKEQENETITREKSVNRNRSKTYRHDQQTTMLNSYCNHVQIFKAAFLNQGSARELSSTKSYLRDYFLNSPKDGTQLEPFQMHRS